MTDTTPRSTSTSPAGPGEPTLGALFATASRDLSTLVRSEIELAKAEIKVDVKNAATGGAMFGAAGLLAVLALPLLLIAAAYGLVAAGLPRAVAFLIVAAVLLLVAGVLVFVGKKAVSKVGPPERTIRTSKDTAAFLKSPRSGDAPSS
jgi:Putative Actinobacterial Holin-X, holin superfamily III